MNHAVFLDTARPEDLETLARIERSSYSHPWSVRHFDDVLRGGRGGILVLREVGRSAETDRGVRAYCVLELVLDEVHIHNLAVHPDCRRQGLGGRLLRLTLWIAARRGATAAFLEVRKSNQPALCLYRAFGFETAGLRRDYYEQPREDAVLLRKIDLGQ